MTFKDIIDLTLNRIDELDSSEQILVIVKTAINDAYTNELSKYDKRVSKSFVPVINGVATLPEDLDTIENISPSLIRGERKVGNVILTSRNIMFEVVYSYIREELVNDTDEVDLNSKFKMLLSTYACYLYYEYRKKTTIAQMFLDEYRLKLSQIMDNDTFGEETVQDAYETVGEE